jgi:hypothetical protein
MEEFTCSGLWWFPDDPDKKRCGTLQYRPQIGSYLSLIDFEPEVQRLYSSVMKRALGEADRLIMVGTSPTCGPVTLYGCYCLNPPVIYAGYQGSSVIHLYASIALLGKHFLTVEEVKFKKLLIDFAHLFEWANISGIKSGMDVELEKPDLLKELDLNYLITYKRPGPIKASISNYTISLYFEREPRLEPWGAKEESCVKQRVYAMIEFADDQSLGTYEDVCYNFRNFLSLGVAHPVYPQEIKGRIDGQIEALDIEILVRLPHYPVTSHELSKAAMLFTYDDISAHFETHLNAWIENSERLKPVCDLYFGVEHNPDTYLIHIFLSLAQALETYHVRSQNKYQLTNLERDSLVKKILSSGKQYNENKLRDPTVPTLLMKLLELLHAYEEIIHPIIDSWSHIEFAEFVKKTRNYYTHYDPKKDSEAPTRDEVWESIQRMKFLLKTCLMSEFGLNKRQIYQFWRRSGSFTTLARELNTRSTRLIHVPFSSL